MIKALFFDIDGTLVSFKTHRISSRTSAALQKARDKGLLLFIATGRHYTDLNNLGSLRFDGYVTLNGQYCYNDKGVLYKNCIDRNDLRETVAEIGRDPFPCMFIEEHRMYINYTDDNFRAVQQLINFPDPEICDPRAALDTDIYQMMPFIGAERAAEMMTRLPNCDSTRWNDCFMDVVPAGGSKRVGIDAIAGAYGFNPDEAMAFGDGQNDIEMLRHAGIGVAMGNAAQEVKQAGDYVTTGVDSDGVARALEKYGII